ncbi:ethanolamine ammonia-lyase reactivating factor EutA [Aedoeadaptatus acetigenes]|uniref:Ethanolamine ammonia-lyase reactivating factor EutA n=1 Tax=Aedoeadaptatus acetigenes TaxID=2981723 RepID=A0ABV1J871_9FIRM|nr:ethanolamine ammonia-lyase reactivating factor EutA [Aedoeadaptatus acetigenes]MCU6786962.1 ethanolamine ammonia-lyase reactivating factor EutA [Aedoeadaptatus acetigenes]
MMHGVIDIGSNTVRLSVFRVEDGVAQNLFNEKQTVGLAGYRKDGCLTEEGIRALIETLGHFAFILDQLGDIHYTHAIATASIRNINNSDEVLRRVKKALGMDIEILSGEEEAHLAFVGAEGTISGHEDGVLADIGGGSTEIVLFREGRVVDSASLDIGSLSVFRDYVDGLFLTNDERKAMDERLKFLLNAQAIERGKYPILCAVGGSARATLKMYNTLFDEHPDNDEMNTDDLKTLMKHLLDIEEKEKMEIILKVKADRIHTLLPGLSILYRIAKYFHVEKIAVAQTGIREGYVISRIIGG